MFDDNDQPLQTGEQDASEVRPATDVALVPRYSAPYSPESVRHRREWVETHTQTELPHVGSHSVSTEQMRGNIENLIGTVQMPLGVAGPVLIHGEEAMGTFYVPLATTEGALVRSYERGMAAITRAGGASVRVESDRNRITPLFSFETVVDAIQFARSLPNSLEALREAAESTTSHGKLLAVRCEPLGRNVLVDFSYECGDAHGMNMIVRATEHACNWIVKNTAADAYHLFSGNSSEKRASGALFPLRKGKKVLAGVRVPSAVLRAYLHVSSGQIADLYHKTMLGHVSAGALGYNGHLANGLTAIFIATGQDVANVTNSAVGLTDFEACPNGDLYASVTLPALSIATVGGGVGLGTSVECLKMLGCFGGGKARKLAEIVGATLLAGELSFAAAISSGEFAAAHEKYGRNRPPE